MQDVNEMIQGYEQARQNERWEQAYWTHCIMGALVKKPPSPKKLMKPFLPTPIKKDSAAFFEQFEKQRKEEENG